MTPARRRQIVSGALDVSASAGLSPREYEYLRLRGLGFRFDDIAREMDISLSTAKTYCEKVHRKLRVTNTIDALRAMGWVTVPE